MRSMSYAEAIEAALEHAMANDDRIVILGEDAHLLRRNLRVRFGPRRVRPCPISESAFLGAGVGAAMAGLRPVVEVMLVDFVAVALDALLNQAAKVATLSGGRWSAPVVVRAACGGGYGDAGQHEQTLWGLLGSIPGLIVVAPSTPADAAGLMLAALSAHDPVVFLEHKLLSDYWLEYMGGRSRGTVAFDVPEEGAVGLVATPPAPVPIGRAAVRRPGRDLTIVSAGVGVHRAISAARRLAEEGIEAEVIDLRTIAPLDRDAVVESARRTGAVLAVDEDYVGFGLTGELAAVVSETRTGARFARLAVAGTLPYDRRREANALPSADRIAGAAMTLLRSSAADGSVAETTNVLHGAVV